MLWEIEMTLKKRNWKCSEEYTSSSAHWNKKTKIESTPKITRALQLTEIEQAKLKVLRRVHEHFSLLKLKKRNGKYFKEYTCSSTNWNRTSKIENTPISKNEKRKKRLKKRCKLFEMNSFREWNWHDSSISRRKRSSHKTKKMRWENDKFFHRAR